MSDNKKRRKSKLELRDVEVNDTANAVLQSSDEEELLITFPWEPTQEIENVVSANLGPSTPPHPNLDHTYALPDHLHTTQPPPTSSFPLTPSVTTPSSASGLHLSVKVEVEEVDELISNEITVPILDVQPKQDSQKSINIFEVDIEKIFKTSDYILRCSTNLADKLLSIEIKNTWGHWLRQNEEEDPYNDLIQKALYKWSDAMLYSSLKHPGVSPLFYQCYICKLAWWHFTPFREHIRIHDLNTLKITHSKNGHESFIYACESIARVMEYIPCEGNCYRCEKPHGYHVKPPGADYSCKKCVEQRETCASMRQHELNCLLTSSDCLNKIYKCPVCAIKFAMYTELDSHMITVHHARSDIVTLNIYKRCRFCRKKYDNIHSHTCLKSTLSHPCEFCHRGFHTKMLHMVHSNKMEKNYRCRICGLVLPSQCMETEHMLNHTSNYRMAYKCMDVSCPSTVLFPDTESIKLHRKLYHKKKIDKRRTYYHKVLLPEQCARSDSVQLIDCADDAAGFRIEKITPEEPEFEDWCIRDEPDEQTDRQTDRQDERDDDVIFIKPKAQEPIVIDSQDDSQDRMDYAEMLSKVFKVSDAVRTARLSSLEEIQTVIKTEPADDENEINIQEEPISIKQEPMDSLERSIVTQTDSNENNSQGSVYRTDTNGDVNIKNEPEDYNINVVYDNRIIAINVEPKDIKKEMLEVAKVDQNIDSNITSAKPQCATQKVVKKRKAKKNPKSLLKDEITELKVTSKKSNSLLKKIIIKKENLTVKRNDLNAEADSNTTEVTKSALKTKSSSDKVKARKIKKIKTLKYDEYGYKIKKLYRCAKCGFENNHRLFRMHQKSFCQFFPSSDGRSKVNKYDCTKCGTEFHSLKAYLVHFTQHGYEALVCPSCNVKFETIRDLLPHFHQHVKRNFLNCWMINEGSNSTKKQKRCVTCREIVVPYEFFSHWESHLQLRVSKMEPKDLEDADIADTVPNNKLLKPTVLHSALEQLRSVAYLKDCNVCSRKFARRFDMKRHLIEHLLMDAHTRKDKLRAITLRCQICLQEFDRVDLYKCHMREHGGLPDYRCELCDKTFSDSSNFAKHKKTHNMGVMICDICKKKFQAKSSLERHMIMHLTTDPLECSHCDKKFYYKSQYKKHCNALHSRQSVFRCVMCDLSFNSSRDKWDHAWRVHNQRKQKADCPICHQEFRKYQDVRKHARTDHDMDLSFYKIKSEAGVVENVKFFQMRKHKKKTT